LRVLVIAAHPDDEVLGAGGTIAKHARMGDEVWVCFAADGGEGTSSVEELKVASIEAAKILGIKEIKRLGFRDQHLETVPLIRIIKLLEEIIHHFKPQVVYTHHHGDLNIDHKIVFNATLTAARPIKKVNIQRVLSFEIHSSTEWSPPFPEFTFVPNVFVDISDTIEQKLEAMKVYKGELREYPHPRSLKAVRIVAERQGAKVGFPAVEAFSLIREIFAII
jgi:LmbE family N-acetylglucosaminyl deacetylase